MLIAVPPRLRKDVPQLASISSTQILLKSSLDSHSHPLLHSSCNITTMKNHRFPSRRATYCDITVPRSLLDHSDESSCEDVSVATCAEPMRAPRSMSFSELRTSSWSPRFARKNETAVKAIQEKIEQQEKRLESMEKLCRHTLSFLTARIQSNNEIGAVLSMKQLLKYEAQKETVQKAITELERVILQAGLSDAQVDYEGKVQSILASAQAQEQAVLLLHRHPAVALDNVRILEQAKHRVQTEASSLSLF